MFIFSVPPVQKQLKIYELHNRLCMSVWACRGDLSGRLVGSKPEGRSPKLEERSLKPCAKTGPWLI